MIAIGEKIKEIRKDNNMTQRQIGNLMTVSASYISRIESGKEKPTEMFIKLFSLIFNVSMENFIKSKNKQNLG